MSPHANDDGVRIVPVSGARRLPWLIIGAVALPVVGTLLAVTFIRASAPPSARSVPAPAVVDVARAEAAPAVERAAAGAPRAPSPSPNGAHVVPRRIVTAPVADPGGLGASPKPAPERSPERELDAGDAIRALREEGIHTGIAAFGLPGTSPPKSGIVVPEDFPLPEGYVRHYQSTDDGQQLPAILMFHPDYDFLNERGEVVQVPDDRIVTPDMAPPGLPLQKLEIPERKVGEPVH